MQTNDPWKGYEYGRLDSEIYQAMGFVGMTTSFRLEMGILYAFCKQNSLKVNPVLMKICYHLSEKYLPMLTLGLDHRIHPAGFRLGFVKLVEKGQHFVEPVVINRLANGALSEINLRSFVPNWQKILMKRFPRLATWLGRYVIAASAVKNYPSLQISRGFLPSVGERITSTLITAPRSHGISIPFGNNVHATFMAPHAFANLNYYDEFLRDFIFMIENPEKVPTEIMGTAYEELK
ncbi:MAG TPA: hypothetical protein VNJ08_01035 [Bacteriovoracaceae bacterium]|nr:hypothetical protein [Bacteriovoracaceae bacterium]